MEENGLWNSFFKGIVRGILSIIIICLISVLLFGLLLSNVSLSDTVIKAVNQFVKILSVFLGCMFSLKGKQGFIRGALSGLVAMSVLTMLFYIISGTEFSPVSFFIDILFGLIAGGISGIIAVNIRK